MSTRTYNNLQVDSLLHKQAMLWSISTLPEGKKLENAYSILFEDCWGQYPIWVADYNGACQIVASISCIGTVLGMRATKEESHFDANNWCSKVGNGDLVDKIFKVCKPIGNNVSASHYVIPVHYLYYIMKINEPRRNSMKNEAVRKALGIQSCVQRTLWSAEKLTEEEGEAFGKKGTKRRREVTAEEIDEKYDILAAKAIPQKKVLKKKTANFYRLLDSTNPKGQIRSEPITPDSLNNLLNSKKWSLALTYGRPMSSEWVNSVISETDETSWVIAGIFSEEDFTTKKRVEKGVQRMVPVISTPRCTLKVYGPCYVFHTSLLQGFPETWQETHAPNLEKSTKIFLDAETSEEEAPPKNVSPVVEYVQFDFGDLTESACAQEDNPSLDHSWILDWPVGADVIVSPHLSDHIKD